MRAIPRPRRSGYARRASSQQYGRRTVLSVRAATMPPPRRHAPGQALVNATGFPSLSIRCCCRWRGARVALSTPCHGIAWPSNDLSLE